LSGSHVTDWARLAQEHVPPHQSDCGNICVLITPENIKNKSHATKDNNAEPS